MPGGALQGLRTLLRVHTTERPGSLRLAEASKQDIDNLCRERRRLNWNVLRDDRKEISHRIGLLLPTPTKEQKVVDRAVRDMHNAINSVI
jgi:hypothetical protein